MTSKISRRRASALLAAARAGAGLAPAMPGRAQPSAAATQNYPSRPVQMIVPFPPGQAADVFARLVADELSKRWPQRVVVDNRADRRSSAGGTMHDDSTTESKEPALFTRAAWFNPIEAGLRGPIRGFIEELILREFWPRRW